MTDIVVVATEDQRYLVVEEANNTITVTSPAPVVVEVKSPGPQGVVGPGVAPGGVAGDLLVKVSGTNYDTAWTDSPTVDKLTFDISAGESLSAEGQMAWNADEETVDIRLNGFVLHTGQHSTYHVKNKTHSTIVKGTPVMFAGTDGNSGKLLIAPWNGTGPSAYFMGICAEALTNGSEGFVVSFGKLRGIQTNGANYGETWVNGDVIYAGTTTGTLTKIPPAAPSPKIIVAAVVSAHASNGTFFIRPTLGSNIKDDEGVTITSLTQGQVLVANSAGTVLENKSLFHDVTLGADGKATVFREKGPAFTYSGGVVTRIDYDSGNYKLFTYSGGVVTRIDYIRGATTIRKDFTYNLDGTLAYITQTEI